VGGSSLANWEVRGGGTGNHARGRIEREEGAPARCARGNTGGEEEGRAVEH
jgi:hypothetical protein